MEKKIPDKYQQELLELNMPGVEGKAWSKELLLKFLDDNSSKDFAIVGGDVIEIDVTDEVLAKDGDIFGRIASQAARQVIIQKVADSEKEKIYDLFV